MKLGGACLAPATNYVFFNLLHIPQRLRVGVDVIIRNGKTLGCVVHTSQHHIITQCMKFKWKRAVRATGCNACANIAGRRAWKIMHTALLQTINQT